MNSSVSIRTIQTFIAFLSRPQQTRTSFAFFHIPISLFLSSRLLFFLPFRGSSRESDSFCFSLLLVSFSFLFVPFFDYVCRHVDSFQLFACRTRLIEYSRRRVCASLDLRWKSRTKLEQTKSKDNAEYRTQHTSFSSSVIGFHDRPSPGYFRFKAIQSYHLQRFCHPLVHFVLLSSSSSSFFFLRSFLPFFLLSFTIPSFLFVVFLLSFSRSIHFLFFSLLDRLDTTSSE